jgi:hypothetical protein
MKITVYRTAVFDCCFVLVPKLVCNNKVGRHAEGFWGTGCLVRYLGLSWRRYIRDWRRMHNEHLCHVFLKKYYSCHEIKEDKQAIHVACMGQRKEVDLMERDNLEDLGVGEY